MENVIEILYKLFGYTILILNFTGLLEIIWKYKLNPAENAIILLLALIMIK